MYEVTKSTPKKNVIHLVTHCISHYISFSHSLENIDKQKKLKEDKQYRNDNGSFPFTTRFFTKKKYIYL